MYFYSPEELKRIIPICDGIWNDDYDGSDSQMGAARIISKMDRQLLQAKRELLLQAQSNEVYWKRPFPDAENLDWLCQT